MAAPPFGQRLGCRFTLRVPAAHTALCSGVRLQPAQTEPTSSPH